MQNERHSTLRAWIWARFRRRLSRRSTDNHGYAIIAARVAQKAPKFDPEPTIWRRETRKVGTPAQSCNCQRHEEAPLAIGLKECRPGPAAWTSCASYAGRGACHAACDARDAPALRARLLQVVGPSCVLTLCAPQIGKKNINSYLTNELHTARKASQSAFCFEGERHFQP